jgi:hypothetical protein
MTTNSAIATGSGNDEAEVSMSKVLSRLKSIEDMMRPLVPPKDQVAMLETAFTEHDQQQQMLSTGLLRVEREQQNQQGPRMPNAYHRVDDDNNDDAFPTTHKMEFPKYDGVEDPLP